MSWNNQLGNEGEELAIEYLQHLKYIILETNWRYKHQEVDIIAINEPFIVFIEVKTRSNNAFGLPYEAVSEKKQKLLIDAAEKYIEQKDIFKEVRFDIISIERKENKYHVDHMQDAFHAEL